MSIGGRFINSLSNHMKNNYRAILLVSVAFVSFHVGLAQKIYIDENVSYWYNVTNEVHTNHNVYFAGDSAYIFFEVIFNDGKKYGEYNYVYELHESYHTLDIKESDTLNIDDHLVWNSENRIVAKLTVPNNDKIDILVIRVANKNTGIDYAIDIPFIEEYNFSTDGLVFYNENGTSPYLSKFTNEGKTMQVKSLETFDQPVYVFYYAQEFDEAVPPWIIEDQKTSRTLSIDSVFAVSTNEPFTLNKKGLYFFQKDSSSANGLGIRVQDPYYPLVKTFDEILAPLIYISTSTETDEIREAPDPQKAFEQYWIDLVRIPSLATTTVRKYYERVEAANYLFTNFEEGWKSDMGLIYIIYGPPNDVYKSEEIIDWVYNRDLSMPVIRFSFYKVKNVFTDSHYTLLRKKNYDKNWFKSVELWRDGKK